MDFNPNTPTTQGIEWNPTTEPGIVLDSATKIAAMSLVQTISQTIGNLRIWLGALSTRGGVYAVEVYDNETAVPSNVATVDFTPNEDVAGTGATDWREDDGTTTTIYTEIDESSLDTADYIHSTDATDPTYYGRVNSASGTITGKRILGVTLIMTVSAEDLTNFQAYRPVLNIGGVDYAAPYTTAPAAITERSYTWWYNPATKLPWTAAEVETFDTTNEYGIDQALSFGVPNPGMRVYQVKFRVTYADENRIAVGVLDDSASALTANAWNNVAMFTPAGVANFTKDAAGRHLYTARRVSETGSITVPTLLEAGVNPNPATGFAPSVDPTSRYVTSMNVGTVAGVFGLIQRTTVPAESVDSQPYVDLAAAAVSVGVTAQQEITAGSSAARNGVYGAQVQPVDAANTVADLLIKIKRRSDNVQMGSTITVTKAEADALADAGGGWKIIDRELTPTTAVFVNGTQYYLEFSSVAASAAVGWNVAYLDTGNQGNAAGYGGTTDRGTPGAIAEADRYDVLGTVTILPTVPADFAGTLVDQALTADGSDCAVEAFERPALTWTPTALGGSFLQYDIDRKDTISTDWERVAELPLEATAAWADSEARRGIASDYRIRSVRSDGVASAWSATVTLTPSAQCCEWAFTSNVDPALNVALNQEGSEIEYQFLDAEDVEFMKIHGRDFQIALRGTESDGAAFRVPVIVSADQAPTVEGVRVFDDLRALMEADLPYVCVLDAKGNRWYADIEVPSGTASTELDYYVSVVEVVEITDLPAVDVAA